VLADKDLILGIRNNYVNVYRHGQSLFKITPGQKTGPLHISTHPKYLVDPDMSHAVKFDGKVFHVSGHKALATEYVPGTLARMKRAAEMYSGGEKRGVHAIMRANANVIDTEVAFNCDGETEGTSSTQRIDLACLEESKGTIRLCFWEAKLYWNPELRAAGDKDAKVVKQVERYGDLIKKHRDQILDSYCAIARNLVQIASWAPQREVNKLVKQVANGEALVMGDVGLIIYDYTEADKKSKFWIHIEKLKERGMKVQCNGKAKSI
jgi:hypothetical protein